MLASNLSKNWELGIETKKNRNSYEQNKILTFMLEILNRTQWTFNCTFTLINLFVLFCTFKFLYTFANYFPCKIKVSG